MDSRAWSDTLALAAPGRGASDTTSLAFTLLASNFPSIKETIRLQLYRISLLECKEPAPAPRDR